MGRVLRRSGQGCGGLLILLFVTGILTGVFRNHKPSSGNRSSAAASLPADEQQARSYISAHGSDAYEVKASVADVELAIGAVGRAATTANVDQLAQQAQTAHDNIDNVRTDFAGSFGTDTLGTAELNAFSGANDLKNAMGALVAYVGDPTAATRAHFTTQFEHAKGEWNSAVRIIWRLARRSHPPTI